MEDNRTDPSRRIEAITEILLHRGVVTPEGIKHQRNLYITRSWRQGARLVAKAWLDVDFRRLLLSNAKVAARELEIDADSMAEFVVLENSSEIHHLIVCTLCSCYPRAVLGDPPQWYKSDEYRARAVRDPRAVLAEFGMVVPESRRVVVVDSSAERRFMVLPRRPQGSEDHSEEQLMDLVTRDCLIGMGEPSLQ